MNLVMMADSYKYSHGKQYPKNMVDMYDYLAARSSEEYKHVVFFGLQYYLNILAKGISIADVNEARDFAKEHGIPFDYDGWSYIAIDLLGKIPVSIKALPEGTIVPLGLPLLTVTATDRNVPWIVGWTETLLMKIWYTSTVATHAHSVKKELLKYGPPEWADFALHMFGDRAASSPESAALAGMAHLTSFKGTDNFNALKVLKDTYYDPMAGFSVYASEHSSTTSHGRYGEEEFVYTQLLENPDAPIMSFVADSYDVFNFVNFCTKHNSRIRQLIESRPHQKLVLRPDSGNPLKIIPELLQIAFKNGMAVEEEHPYVFKDIGFLWGDGITKDTITDILDTVIDHGFSPKNMVFGMGGNMVHAKFNRDTLGFAMKCSEITVNTSVGTPTEGSPAELFERIPVFKDPITDPGKASLKGKVSTFFTPDKGYFLGTRDPHPEDHIDKLSEVFRNGDVKQHYTMSAIRNNIWN